MLALFFILSAKNKTLLFSPIKYYILSLVIEWNFSIYVVVRYFKEEEKVHNYSNVVDQLQNVLQN